MNTVWLFEHRKRRQRADRRAGATRTPDVLTGLWGAYAAYYLNGLLGYSGIASTANDSTPRGIPIRAI